MHTWLHPDVHVDDVCVGMPATIWCQLNGEPVPATVDAVAHDDDGEPCEFILRLEAGLPPFARSTAEPGGLVHVQLIHGWWVTQNELFRSWTEGARILIGRRVLPKEIAA
jgi:hypothetical protein